MCKLVDESIVTDQLKWAMLSLEQRLTNMTLAMLQIECDDFEHIDSFVTVLAVDDYRLVSGRCLIQSLLFLLLEILKAYKLKTIHSY